MDMAAIRQWNTTSITWTTLKHGQYSGDKTVSKWTWRPVANGIYNALHEQRKPTHPPVAALKGGEKHEVPAKDTDSDSTSSKGRGGHHRGRVLAIKNPIPNQNGLGWTRCFSRAARDSVSILSDG